MENSEFEPECKYCNDEGHTYTCLNCYNPATYDSEFGVIVCDDCFLLDKEQNTISEKCTHCDIADRVIETPNIGDIFNYPNEQKINWIIGWLYNLKIPHGQSYDIIQPIAVNNFELKYFSNVENTIKYISLDNLKSVIVNHRNPTLIRWSTTLNGLKGYLKEERNKELMQDSIYVRLPFAEGCSWDLSTVNQDDVINKNNLKENHYVNGVTFNIKDLLNDKFLGFPNLRISNPECYHRNKENNILYLIESIKKFELF